LLAAHLGFQLGLLKSDAISKDELQVKLGKSSKIVSTRLSELVKSDIGAKTPEDNYRLTSFGVAQMQKEIIARVKARAGI
jgi:predicted transcriptional regulator